jgi:hypothetical protein
MYNYGRRLHRCVDQVARQQARERMFWPKIKEVLCEDKRAGHLAMAFGSTHRYELMKLYMTLGHPDYRLPSRHMDRLKTSSSGEEVHDF